MSRSQPEIAIPSLDDWLAPYGPFEPDPSLAVAPELAAAVLGELAERLAGENYPFGHPVYAGQMLKPPHPVAMAAYALAMRVNPNNHALDGGPATAAMEREVVGRLATMAGYDPARSLGHLTSSGTIANLEALWVARELADEDRRSAVGASSMALTPSPSRAPQERGEGEGGPSPASQGRRERGGRAVAGSAAAHYTHARMCQVLGVPFVPIAAGPDGRMDLGALDVALAAGDGRDRIGTVVATGGTTSLGAVDPIDAIVARCRAAGVRVHLDAAYGGFFRVLADGDQAHGDRADGGRADGAGLAPEVAAAFRAMGECDSVVIDPHKHGLQPYGCGAVLFRDAAVGRLYAHDSPYTYFTSDELHLGEISLECSRAGASAAALWATLRCLPLEAGRGFGPVLAKTRSAAVTWAGLIGAHSRMRLVTPPDLDIVCWYPLPADGDRRVSAISAQTQAVFTAGMRRDPEAFFLAKLTMTPGELTAAGGHGDLEWDTDRVTVLRSVLMKPEHAEFVGELHARVGSVLDGPA